MKPGAAIAPGNWTHGATQQRGVGLAGQDHEAGVEVLFDRAADKGGADLDDVFVPEVPRDGESVVQATISSAMFSCKEIGVEIEDASPAWGRISKSRNLR